MYKVSAIVPVYNAEKTIIKCLDSIINQTVIIYEIIVVNDGSTDNTVSIILDYIESNPSYNIILLNQINSGPSAARNLGIEKATGDLVAFLDSDDAWLPKKTEEQIEILEKHKNPITLIGSSPFVINHKQCNNEYAIINLTKLLWGNCFPTSTVMIWKKLLMRNKFEVGQNYSEDYGLWLKLLVNSQALLTNNVVMTGSLTNYKNGGLSSHLWKMECGELKNYKYLFKNAIISRYSFYFFSVFSLIKYIKRYLTKKFSFLSRII